MTTTIPEAKPGRRSDGVRTYADLIDRCTRDDETGCLLWPGARRQRVGRGVVWIPGHGACSITRALSLLQLGQLPGRRMWVPTCGNVLCANADHRKAGNQSEMQKAIRPTLSPQHRARITAGVRKALATIDMETADALRRADGTLEDLAAQSGLHPSRISKILRGEAWAHGVPGSSVFTWRPDR